MWFISQWGSWKPRGFFSSSHGENLVELQEVVFTKLWRLPHDWFLWNFYLSEPPAIHQLQFGFPSQHWFSWRFQPQVEEFPSYVPIICLVWFLALGNILKLVYIKQHIRYWRLTMSQSSRTSLFILSQKSPRRAVERVS